MNTLNIKLKSISKNTFELFLPHRLESNKSLKQDVIDYAKHLDGFFNNTLKSNNSILNWTVSNEGIIIIQHVYKFGTPQSQIRDNDNYHPLAIKRIIDSFVTNGIILDDAGNHLDILFTMTFDSFNGTNIIYKRRI